MAQYAGPSIFGAYRQAYDDEQRQRLMDLQGLSQVVNMGVQIQQQQQAAVIGPLQIKALEAELAKQKAQRLAMEQAFPAGGSPIQTTPMAFKDAGMPMFPQNQYNALMGAQMPDMARALLGGYNAQLDAFKANRPYSEMTVAERSAAASRDVGNQLGVANYNLSAARARDEGIGGIPGLSLGVPGAARSQQPAPVAAPSPQAVPQAQAPTPAAAPADNTLGDWKPTPGLSPKQTRDEIAARRKTVQERLAERPQAGVALDQALEGYSQLERDVNDALSGPINRVTGVLGMFPNIPGGAAADVDTKLKQIGRKSALATMNALKQASKQGATGFGQLSNKELELLQNSLAALDRAQGESAVRGELNNLLGISKTARQRLKDSYDQSYGTKSGLPLSIETGQNNDPLGLRGGQ